MIITKKLRLIVVEEDKSTKSKIYNYIKEEQYQQYRALNIGMTLLCTHYELKNIGSGTEKKLENEIKKINDMIAKAKDKLTKTTNTKTICSLTNNIKDNQNRIIKLKERFTNIHNTRILEDNNFKEKYINDLYTVLQSQVSFQNKDNMSLVTQKLKADFKTSLSNGLARGERSLTRYKRSTPLMIRGRDLVLYKDTNKQGCDTFYIKWIKGIKFKIIIGRNDKDTKELLYTLNKIIHYQSEENKIDKIIDGKPMLDENGKIIRINNPNKNYKICDSSFEFHDNKLILNLSLDINNYEKVKFIPGRIVGVDLGIKIPAYVALNDKYFIRKSIGSYESFMKVNVQMKNRRNRLQKQIKKSKGGKGRKIKLQALNKLREKRSNYNTSYNHFLSKEIVKFALDNQAEQINMEFLTSESFKKNKILADWSYYELQKFVEYKAKKYGILVKYIDPYKTSQTCSICNHYEEGQRKTQAVFECKNCKAKINADYNAAQNISRSTKYVDKIEDTEYYRLKKKAYMTNEPEEKININKNQGVL